MDIKTNLPYKKHVFVCVNEREGSCCAAVHGKEIFYELKRWVISEGLTQSIWVTKTGCLGFCNNKGTTIVIYPERIWFLQTTKEDIGEIKKKCQDFTGHYAQKL
jgi:(2Fe-2S) ferredoxin